jgi:hypothetical protein
MTTVWTFTNKRELNKSEFLNYFERKVFRTIRKFGMLSKEAGRIKLKKSGSLNVVVLKSILEKKFEVKFSNNSNFSSDNLSQIAEDVFKNVLKGDFSINERRDAPLIYLSDKEIELYAKLMGLKGVVRERDERIRDLFKKFLGKNQDLELNILKAQEQINKE